MRNLLSFLLVVAVAVSAFGQGAKDLAKEQAELNSIYMKMLEAKPTKDAKKQARQLKKEGWTVPVGEKSIEQQITESQLLGAEYMVDENGASTQRYIQQTAMQTAGTYNAAYAAARSNAQIELASLLKTELVAAMQSRIDNSQSSSITVETVVKFNAHARTIVDATLTNLIPVLAIYRNLPNKYFEVQVRIAFDKKELATRIKHNMQKELEAESDELLPLIDEVLSSK